MSEVAEATKKSVFDPDAMLSGDVRVRVHHPNGEGSVTIALKESTGRGYVHKARWRITGLQRNDSIPFVVNKWEPYSTPPALEVTFEK